MEKQYKVAQNVRLHRKHHDIGATVTVDESEVQDLVDSGALVEIDEAAPAPAPAKKTITPPAPAIETPDQTVTEKPVTTPPKAPAKGVPKARAAKPKAAKGSKAK
ncbi:hypothetical protein DXT88_22130 [Herbaspirillum lusitanum]|uniref:DUF7302 family protein n=1 Tax=Herbaspirillum lusitanum TaxID=213312 RepID=UPI002238A5CF|nr:hypothetical protein [Herbaspirillum lusitanum]MCW5300874.1 hypothetical protein [Herbaspirillum lusitanum]